jgi:hypothetical protein
MLYIPDTKDVNKCMIFILVLCVCVCARITRFYIALITIIKESSAPGPEPCGVAGRTAHHRRRRYEQQPNEKKKDFRHKPGVGRERKQNEKGKKIPKPRSLRDSGSVLLIL